MSIIIEGMEMPKDCTECWFRKTARHEYLLDCQICPFSGEITPYTKRKDDCPLVHVPAPHGQLGDLDELFRTMENKGWFDNADRDIAEDIVLNAVTIIPASLEGET